MSATRDLIAAALTAADLLDEMWLLPQDSREGEKLREACARAMVQPDMAEVERLADEYATAVHDGRDNDCYKTRAALLDYVRGVLAERDHAVLCADAYKAEADQFRDAAKMVSAAPQPVDEPCRVDQPAGWRCTRANGHKGPCAAVEDRA